MSLIASCVQRKAPVRLTSTTEVHCSKDTSSSGTAGAPEPALLKRRSNRPNAAFVLANRAFTDRGSRTSVGILSIRAPSLDPSAAVLSRGSFRRPATTTEYPSPARATATALPIPVPPPAAEFGIAVANAAGYNRDAVADWAVMAILNLVRRGSWGDRAMRDGGWPKPEMLGHELGALTMGIVGLGNVGSALATRLLAFGSRVLYTDIVERSLAGVERVPFEELTQSAEAGAVHVPLANGTQP